jgi:glutamate racemase
MDVLLQSHIQPMLKKKIDYLVLGCTHYPFLTPQIEALVGDKVKVLDSGEAIARQTKVILEQESRINKDHSLISRFFYTNKDTNVLQNILDEFGENLSATKLDF